MRREIIERLRELPALGGRVYQAFLAPLGPTRTTPYATVKMASQRQSVDLGMAFDQTIEVRLYRDQDTFVDLDALRRQVIGKLNGVQVGGHTLKYTTFGAGDFSDDEQRLIGCLVTFETVVIYERSGQTT